MNKRGFIFKGIRRWYVINLVTLNFAWNCCRLQEAKKFKFKKANSSVFQGKSRIRRGTLCMESREPSRRISPKTKDHIENTLFQWRLPIFPKMTWIKSLYDRVENLFIYWPGGIIWDAEVISTNLSTGEATGAHLTGAFGQVFMGLIWRWSKLLYNAQKWVWWSNRSNKTSIC